MLEPLQDIVVHAPSYEVWLGPLATIVASGLVVWGTTRHANRLAAKEHDRAVERLRLEREDQRDADRRSALQESYGQWNAACLTYIRDVKLWRARRKHLKPDPQPDETAVDRGVGEQAIARLESGFERTREVWCACMSVQTLEPHREFTERILAVTLEVFEVCPDNVNDVSGKRYGEIRHLMLDRIEAWRKEDAQRQSPQA